MIEVRPFSSLGHAHHGWLNARHHFSFAEYQDPQRVNWGRLRVWNDDEIAAGSGFPPHPHSDMEIITYVREGAITHQDHLGNQGRTEAGDVQVMSAGTGIQHAEYNREDVTSSIFQIWILPDRHGHAPSWGTRSFPKGERAGQFVVLASGVASDPDALPMADDRDMDYYIRALDSGALTPIFAHAPWGEVSLRYEALVMDDKVCPGLRACWTDPLAFLAEGKADDGFNVRIESMVGAFGRMVSAEWWRWQVRVV